MGFETTIFKRVGEIALEARIFRPEANHVDGNGADRLTAGARPALVLFSCGGWQTFGLDKVTPEATYFAGRGMVSIAIQVRVLNKHQTSPTECLIDAKTAIRWVRAQAGSLGIDANKITVTGDSASGHISASLCLIEGFDDPADDLAISARPNAAAIICPALVIHHTQARIEKFGGTERARALSPVLQVKPGAPPMLVLAGGDDRATYPEEAWLFQREMLRVGARCELEIFPGEGHGMQLYADGKNPMFYICYRKMDRFLSSLGYLWGDPTVDAFPFSRLLPADWMNPRGKPKPA